MSLPKYLLAFLFLAAGPAEADTVTETVPLSFEIEPVTVLDISSETGANAVRLGPLSPSGESPSRILEVNIRTNLRRPYRVYHQLSDEVTNAAGEVFPEDYLLFMATSGRQGGNSLFPSLSPIPRQETAVFSSGAEGGPDSFNLVYSIQNTRLFPAGLYYGNLHLEVRND